MAFTKRTGCRSPLVPGTAAEGCRGSRALTAYGKRQCETLQVPIFAERALLLPAFDCPDGLVIERVQHDQSFRVGILPDAG